MCASPPARARPWQAQRVPRAYNANAGRTPAADAHRAASIASQTFATPAPKSISAIDFRVALDAGAAVARRSQGNGLRYRAWTRRFGRRATVLVRSDWRPESPDRRGPAGAVLVRHFRLAAALAGQASLPLTPAGAP